MEDLSDSNSELSQKIVDLTESGNKFEIENDSDKALENYHQAWALLPAPPERWDLANWISSCISNLLFDSGNYAEAKKWAIIAIKTKPPRETSSLIDFAKICYELGEKELAIEYFDKAFKLGKKRAFEGFDNKYLNFYLENIKV
ncbi:MULTISPECIES: tetratricopeptide repeat protein [Pseudomonas syringae group]|uniref:tetratricopeptide repeat protein n=1 Tax=Pseudomonas syringae group TaxID=136849 RepID=UPI00070DF8CB|nr:MULTISPECIES: hypothetical protein [Pseudomonas syringae group]MDU8631086.1 hypothetical protein [Pseudomonas syringae group sp. 243L2]UBT81967.1 hypothetical protein LCH33_005433 [Pseudomonas amygdali]